MRFNALFPLAILLAMAAVAQAGNPNDIFIVRTTSKTPDAVVAAIKSYSKRQKWQFLSDSKVKKGTVRLVKICIPKVGQLIWPLGLQLSALLPCGNVGIYKKGAATEISVLHPRYMHVLYPHPVTKGASTVAEPLLSEMLDAVIE